MSSQLSGEPVERICRKLVVETLTESDFDSFPFFVGVTVYFNSHLGHNLFSWEWSTCTNHRGKLSFNSQFSLFTHRLVLTHLTKLLIHNFKCNTFIGVVFFPFFFPSLPPKLLTGVSYLTFRSSAAAGMNILIPFVNFS